MKVSVIIPVYNAAAFLSGCLENVCAQSLRDLEIICVNDGSTDGSRQVLLDWQARDGRIRLIDQRNAGSGAARNAGLEAASGEFVTFLDSDDGYPESGVLELLYRSAVQNRVQIAGGSFRHVHLDGRVVDNFTGAYAPYTFDKAEKRAYSSYQFDYGYHRFIFSRHLIDAHRIRFPDYRRFQDPPFFVRAMIAAQEFFSVPARVYSYRKGHQKVAWNAVAVTGLLFGLTDNLLMSRMNELGCLHRTTLRRFCGEYRAPILAQAKGDYCIRFCLDRFWGALDPALILETADGVEDLLELDFAYGAFAGAEGVANALESLHAALALK